MEKYLGFLVIILMGAVIVAAATNISFFGAPRDNPPNNFGFFSIGDEAYTPLHSPQANYAGRTPTPPPSAPTKPAAIVTTKTDNTDTLRKALLLRRESAGQHDPQKEYIDLRYRPSFLQKEELFSLDLTDWTIENKRGDRFALSYAANLPYASQVNQLARLIVPPDSTIHIVSGRGPFNASFRANTCTGYFDQFDAYTPRLDHDCPRPSEEPAQSGLNDTCLDYIESLPRCRIPQNTLLDIGNACRSYITNNISYSGCVANHKIDPDFYQNEWFVYLGRPTELWKEKREKIILRDPQGALMAELEY